MGGFQAEGASDFSRLIILRDDSLHAGGVRERDELGSFEGALVGVVETVDEDGLRQKVRQGFLMPRNWHEIEKPKPISPLLSGLPDRRFGISLIVDHQNDFPGWRVDERASSPLLDDWFHDGQDVNTSTRFVDNRDPKGRVALLSQLVIVKDDHRQQYSPAICMGPEVGNHEKAGAGLVHDPDKGFLGQLHTLLATNHDDELGKGRELTPWGILGLRQDHHIEWPGVGHGRIKFAKLDCSAFEEMPLAAGGGAKGPSDSKQGPQEPRVHFYKSVLAFDPTVKNQDSELGHESVQYRPVYHCVDVPEKPKKTPGGGFFELNDNDEITSVTNISNITNNSSTTIIVIINNGPGGAGRIVEIFDPQKPGQPPTITEIPGPPTQADDFLGLGSENKPHFRETPPQGAEGGRVICIPLSHAPPLLESIEHKTHGYFAISEDGQGWIGGWQIDDGPGVHDASQLDALVEGAKGAGAIVKRAKWTPVVGMPAETPQGHGPVSDGEGSFSWEDPGPRIREEAQRIAGELVQPPSALLFDIAGYDTSRSDETVDDGYVWEPDEGDPRKFRLRRRQSGADTDEALLVDGSGIGNLYTFERLVVTKPDGTTDGYVPVADAEFGVLWQPMSSIAQLPTGYLVGALLSYDPDFPSLVHVTDGRCRDSTDSYDIEIAADEPDYLSNGGLQCNDALLAGDVGDAGTGSGTWSGDGSFATAGLDSGNAWTDYLNGRTVTGTIDVSARDGTTKLQQITGTGSKFFDELAVGDIVGNSTCGHGAVAKIDSDTVAWIIKEFSELSSATHSSQTFTLYENVCIQVGLGPACRISEISKNGKVVYTPDGFNGGSFATVASGLAVYIGQPAPRTTWVGVSGLPQVAWPSWVYLWARRDADGNSTLSWSTQRTTPYSPSTLTDYSIWGRIGVLPIQDDNYVYPFAQVDEGAARVYEFEDFSANLTALNGGTANATWTRLSLGEGVPPVSRRAILTWREKPTSNRFLYARTASTGTSSLSRMRVLTAMNGEDNSSELNITTDGAQCIDYTHDGPNGVGYFYIRGYVTGGGGGGGASGGGGGGDPALGGDLSGTASAAVVETVGGVAAADIAAGLKPTECLLLAKNADQSISSSATSTTISWSSVVSIRDSGNVSLSSDKFYPDAPGIYEVALYGLLARKNGMQFTYIIEQYDSGGGYLDGAELAGLQSGTAESDAMDPDGTVSRHFYVAAGDYFMTKVRQVNSGAAAVNLRGSGRGYTSLSIVRTQ